MPAVFCIWSVVYSEGDQIPLSRRSICAETER